MREAPTLKRKFLFPSVTIGALAVGLLVAWFSYGSTKLPDEFVAGRDAAAILSQRIVDITASVADRIKEANQSEQAGEKEIAEALLREAHDRNYEAQLKARELSDELRRLTLSLNDFSSGESQRLAYQAISLGLALVEEYIKYTQDLKRFLELVPLTFGSVTASDRDAVEKTLAAINQRAGTINTMNGAFVEKMREFDRSL